MVDMEKTALIVVAMIFVNLLVAIFYAKYAKKWRELGKLFPPAPMVQGGTLVLAFWGRMGWELWNSTVVCGTILTIHLVLIFIVGAVTTTRINNHFLNRLAD